MNQPTRLALLINPTSGSQKSKEVFSYLPFLEQAGKKIEVFEWKNRDEINSLPEKILQWNPDAVVAVGGDGTVNFSGKFLLHKNIPLGIIPTGSGNGLARHLGIPMKLEDAVKKLISPRLLKIDAGKIDGNFFFCSAGLGYDALIAHRFANLKKRGLWGYTRESILALGQFKPQPFKVTFNEKIHHFDALILTFGNAAQYGNNAYIAPQADITDGLLELTVIEKINPLKVPVLVYKLFNKNLHLDSGVKTFSSNHFLVQLQESGIIHYDGESGTCGKEVILEIIPSALQVLV